MANRRSANWLNQQRVNVSDMRSIESAIRSDYDELLKTLILGQGSSYVLRGFEISMPGSIGASANGLQLIVDDAALFHQNSDIAGTFFNVQTGADNVTLSSTVSTRVEGAFTPGSLNYVGIEFNRVPDNTTSAQAYFWNPTTASEFTKNVPLAELLDFKVIITSAGFASNVLPVSIIETNASNNVLSIQDRRPMLFRLGTAGTATPNPFYNYPWDNQPEGRTENHWQSSSSSSSPFRGGDKQILTQKEWMDSVMTSLKEIKGTTYWYSPSLSGSLSGIRYDIANTLMTGRGSVIHSEDVAGQINWNNDIFLTVVSTRLKYKLESNDVPSTDITLADGECAYVELQRNIDVIPQLIFTNGSPIVSSVGGVPWTANLEAGDYVKVGAEEDTHYYPILTVDSVSQVTLAVNFADTSTGIIGTSAKVSYGVYRTDAAPSLPRHIKVAAIEDTPFNDSVFWLMFRDDNGDALPRVYVRFLAAELEQGEERQISDNTSTAVLTYTGMANESDSTPSYDTVDVSASETKADQQSYNSLNEESLTVRLAKLTAMMADKAQDKTIKLVSDHSSVSNTTNGTAQDITFSGGSGFATSIIPSSDNNGSIGLGGVLSLEEDQVAYYTVDRNAAFSLADLTELTVVDIADCPLNENIFIFAYRAGDTNVYLWDGTALETGSTPVPAQILKIISQNNNSKMIAGGTWSYSEGVTNDVTLSADAYVQVSGLSDVRNTISAQTFSLAAGEVAYVEINRDAGAADVRSVQVASISALDITNQNIVIIARKVSVGVIIGTHSFLLKAGEYLELDGALAEINRYFGQLQLKPHESDGNKIRVTGADISKLNSSTLSLSTRNLLLKFDGAVIDFTTGEVFESDGVTALGVNFTPFTIGAGEYFYYSVTVIPAAANPDNTIGGQILVLPASASNAVLASAPKAPFSSGIQLGQVYVEEDTGGIVPLTYTNIIQLGVGGSGGGGTGDISSDETSYRDRLDLSVYKYANTNIASIDEGDQLDGVSTASFDIPTGTFKFLDSTAQVLQSISQLDTEFLETGVDIKVVDLNAIWKIDSIDTAAVYEITRDGGNEWQTVAMERVGLSDLYSAKYVFEDEATNGFNQEYAVANADDESILDDSASLKVSQKFTVASLTVFKDIIAYLNKATINAVGKYYLEIVADDAGAPSLEPTDSLWTSTFQDVSDLSVGANTVDISSSLILPAGDYHLIVHTDLEYQNGYISNNADYISARIDSSAGPTPNLRTFNGTIWSAEVANSTMVYRLEGRVLDVRVRITSSATAGDKLLSSYALFYGDEDDNLESEEYIKREVFSFDGIVDNLSSFTVSWIPDPRLVTVYAREVGQVFRYGDFLINGSTIVFPDDSFNASGSVSLEIVQLSGSNGAISSGSDQLMTDNQLGSEDGAVDRSVAGGGTITRRPDGTLVRVTVDNDNIITIKDMDGNVLNGKKKTQTKYLTSAVSTTTADVVELKFGNLVIGKWYSISGLMTKSLSGGSGSLVVNINSGATLVCRNSSQIASGGSLVAGTREHIKEQFQAEATELIVSTSISGSASLSAGGGAKTDTYLTLTEIDDLEPTTDFNP